jgi:hypothetical protein
MGRAHHMQHSVGIKEKEIWLWHYRLGHPSFTYMKHLFPELFSQVQHFDFQCETCTLAKSHRVTYPAHLNKKDTLFSLIHSDVWVLFQFIQYQGSNGLCSLWMTAPA